MRTTVTLAAGPTGGVRLEYADNGPGIPADAKERVFERVFVVPRPGVEAGTGLGLHYVGKVVRLHGWTIREVGADDGVRFVLEFPPGRGEPV